MDDQAMDPAFAPLARQPRKPLVSAVAVRAEAVAARQPQSNSTRQQVEIEDRLLPAADRASEPLRIRIYRGPQAAGTLPVLLYLHGGGFFVGDELSDEPQCVAYACGAPCAVVTVGYRLAPEAPFPAALDDCYRVLEFLCHEARQLKLDPERIAIGGSSAGGNLAAAVALLARDRNGPKLCFQMLLIPALDDRLETPSAKKCTDVPGFARPEAEVMWRWYLGRAADPVSCYAAPARAEDLARLPASYILCAGLDPLRDEGLHYAHRLAEAGVAVELHLVSSIPHSFQEIPSAAITRRLLREQVQVLRGAFLIQEPS